MSQSRSIFCTVENTILAENLLNKLKAENIPNHNISVLFADSGDTKRFVHEKHTKAPEGMTTGVGTGGVIGGVLGWLVGIGSLAIPGLGPFIAAGPIMATLSGVAIGAAAGGLIGTLVGLGIPEIEAKKYEAKLKQGNVLIAVHTEDKEESKFVKEIFKRSEAHDISALEDIPA